MKNYHGMAERAARADRLKQARIKSGYGGVWAVSKKFGWNLNTYKAHDSGKNGFGTAEAKEYAKAFGVSLEWLYFGTGSPNDAALDEQSSIEVTEAIQQQPESLSLPAERSIEQAKDDHQISGWRERLREAIAKSGRSNADIAVACGLGRGYMTNIFKDGKEPTIGNLLLICREIGVGASKIIYGYDVSWETEEIISLFEQNPELRGGILQILRAKSKSESPK